MTYSFNQNTNTTSSQDVMLYESISSQYGYNGTIFNIVLTVANYSPYDLDHVILYYTLNPALSFIDNSLTINGLPNTGCLSTLDLPSISAGTLETPSILLISFQAKVNLFIFKCPICINNTGYLGYWLNSDILIPPRYIQLTAECIYLLPIFRQIIKVPLCSSQPFPSLNSIISIIPSVVCATQYPIDIEQQSFVALTYNIDIVYLDSLCHEQTLSFEQTTILSLLLYDETMDFELELFGRPIYTNLCNMEIDLEVTLIS